MCVSVKDYICDQNISFADTWFFLFILRSFSFVPEKQTKQMDKSGIDPPTFHLVYNPLYQSNIGSYELIRKNCKIW